MPLNGSRILFYLILGLLSVHSAMAQLQVDINFKRTLYIAYEPLIVNVSLTNLTGNPLELSDAGNIRWFGFQIETLDGRPIPPRESTHTNPPLRLEPGQTLTRAVNLTPLYPISEFGGYRIRASIYEPKLAKWFNSSPLNIEITEGRTIFEKTVGIPQGESNGGAMRKITLLTHRLPSSTQLYMRIEDPANGMIYCTHRLGRLVTYGTPEIILDKRNRPNVFQNVSPKVFLHSVIGLNGEVLERKLYNQSGRARPAIQLKPDGKIAILGATEYNPENDLAEKPLPNLSDRPVPLPGVETDSKPKDARPKNLLSQ